MVFEVSLASQQAPKSIFSELYFISFSICVLIFEVLASLYAALTASTLVSGLKHLLSDLPWPDMDIATYMTPFFSSTQTEPDKAEFSLKKNIADMYDNTSTAWLDLWGHHFHHGYYPEGGYDANHTAAQLRMIDQLLKLVRSPSENSSPISNSSNSPLNTRSRSFLSTSNPVRVLDIGCGVGSSSLYIASKNRSATCQGITLSKQQRALAEKLAYEHGLSERCKFDVIDALCTPFGEKSFDLLWALESAEHIPRKPDFIKEIGRLAAPGSTCVMATWCHRSDTNSTPLTFSETQLLRKISDNFHLPEWYSIEDYVTLFEKNGFVNIQTLDWTDFVLHFWPAVVKSGISLKGLKLLCSVGLSGVRNGLASFLMICGYRIRTIKYQVLIAKKP